MFKKIAVLATALAVSAPAFADRGYRHGHGHGHGRHVVVHKHHYVPAHVPARPVVHHYYRPAPRPVYVVHRPAPVYHYSHPNTGAALLVGAVIGAAIVHHAVTGY